MKAGMLKVSVLYPGGENTKFDIEYYAKKHIPFVAELLGDALKSVAVDKGLAGMAPGSAAPYVASAHLYFDSVEAFQTAFGPNLEKFQADLANFTNVEPVVQISEVVI